MKKSEGDDVFYRPPRFEDNLRDRRDAKRRNAYQHQKHLAAPNTSGPNGLLSKKTKDPRDAIGEYKTLHELLKSTRVKVLRAWPNIDARTVRELLRSLLEVPQVPLQYPAINENTEEDGHQCFLPWDGEIQPNPLVDLPSQFLNRDRMPEHLARVCPHRVQGCRWEATSISRYQEHQNLTHMRYPLLLLCPAADCGCFYLASSTEDLDSHIKAKADKCARHAELQANFERNQGRARSAYVYVRVYNPNAIVARGWPRILDFRPRPLVNGNEQPGIAYS